ncbi:MAG: hypothetical protein EPN82_09250 [Bacteroidetes bacterium]|nr:MAG: hypothetical protein EPN82_09250 [Bacteroidota bacterium]
MADFPGIAEGGGIKPLNPEERKEKDYLRLPLSQRTKDVQLRVGEILQATILEVLSSQEAIVQLPTGTVHAFIHGRLKKGDVVFLKVHEIAPNLVLRIHSVSIVKNGLELSDNEILRILDLPERLFFIELIRYLKKHRTHIHRDEGLIIENSFTSLDDSIRKEHNSDIILSAIMFMLENKLPVDSRIFMKIAPVLSGNIFVLNLLKELEQSVPQLPDAVKNNIESFFRMLKSESVQVNRLLEVFLIDPGNTEEKSLYENLISILLIPDNEISREIKKAKEISKRLVQVIEGQHFLNTFGINNNSALYFYLPFQNQNTYSMAKIIIRGISAPKQSEKKIIKFSIITATPELGEIITSGDFTSGAININFLTDSKDLAVLFTKHLNSLKEKLNLHNKNVQSIVVEDGKRTKSGGYENGRQPPTNFSIVV